MTLAGSQLLLTLVGSELSLTLVKSELRRGAVGIEVEANEELAREQISRLELGAQPLLDQDFHGLITLLER